MMVESDFSVVERTRRAIGRAGYLVAMLGLVAGVALFLAQQPAMTRTVLIGTVGLLLSLPVLNVVAILAEEIRKRDWPFVLVAIGVLALLAFNVAWRLFQS